MNRNDDEHVVKPVPCWFGMSDMVGEHIQSLEGILTVTPEPVVSVHHIVVSQSYVLFSRGKGGHTSQGL